MGLEGIILANYVFFCVAGIAKKVHKILFSLKFMFIGRNQSQVAGFYAVPTEGSEACFESGGEVWIGSDFRLPWHTNRGWEVYLQQEGSTTWEVEGYPPFRLEENGFYRIAPGVRHRLLGQSERIHFSYVVFWEGVIPPVLRSETAWTEKACFGANGQGLVLPFRGFVSELKAERMGQFEVCAGYLANLCYEVSRAFGVGGQRRRSAVSMPHPAAERLHSLLTSRVDYPWTMKELSQICGVSLCHLIGLYRCEYGETPMRSLKRLRLEEVSRLLRETDLPITEIAYSLCFSSSQHLSRDFRKATGQSPREFRAAVTP